ncbi:hypothetical protein O0235_00080 [Tepidiforma flava]|uniref:AB hydrolase-1 domain-containing protein n=1 Tax=Tepidiforma flava TaxID=3004094 RepID=A0ABY7M6C8_9CHLR|nr:alpha/beta fold hydrolase [Tepidiforma flava]WBL36069.1 hypothetical protein O0235_00080 [Tepidiforma flava]
MTVFLQHNRVKLALHTLREAPGPRLLLLHALGDRSPERLSGEVERWPGAVYALDFTGHGSSSVPAGGGYTAEVLMGDADVALAAIGPATVVGRGLGGYIGLLLAGARPGEVRGVAILDGAGLAGGGDTPGPAVVRGVPGALSAPDPFALVELGSDLRPRQYVRRFAELATEHSPLANPIAVCGRQRPAWLEAVLEVPGVVEEPLEAALQRFAAFG